MIPKLKVLMKINMNLKKKLKRANLNYSAKHFHI